MENRVSDNAIHDVQYITHVRLMSMTESLKGRKPASPALSPGIPQCKKINKHSAMKPEVRGFPKASYSSEPRPGRPSTAGKKMLS